MREGTRRDASERNAEKFLLVEACEEVDGDGSFVPFRERRRATVLAWEAVGHPSEDSLVAVRAFLEERAENLARWLRIEYPAFRVAEAVLHFSVPLVAVVLLATGAGLLVDALGNARAVNLLSFPLLGLLAWNTVMIGVSLVRRLRAALGQAPRIGSLRRLRVWLADPGRAWIRIDRTEAARWFAAALDRFAEIWAARLAAFRLARTEAALHLGAAMVALGFVAGMYVRGIAFEYQATWESTFLETSSVHAVLDVVLGPASQLTGIPVPGPAVIAALRAPGSGPAAPWIHLWATTALLWIGVPRLLLAVEAAWRVWRHAPEIGPLLGDPYALRLLTTQGHDAPNVEIVPYSHSPSPRVLDRLREALHELFGVRARVMLREAVPYGADEPGHWDPSPGERATAGRRISVVVFSLAQPPEHEVHGAWIEALQKVTRERAAKLLVVLDAEPYQPLPGDEGERRRHERHGAWKRLFRENDLVPVLVADESAGEIAASAAPSFWPPVTGAVS